MTAALKHLSPAINWKPGSRLTTPKTAVFPQLQRTSLSIQYG